jgi:hypothetical protein
MKKSELRKIIRETIKEQAIDQFGGTSGFGPMTDPQTFGNIAGGTNTGMSFGVGDQEQLPATTSYTDFIAANPGVEGQFDDAGTFNAEVFFSNFSEKVANAQNPCNFLKNQSDNLASKYPTAGRKYKSQLFMKIFIMNTLAMSFYGCGMLPSTPVIFGTLDLGQAGPQNPNISVSE